jgi:hypothetical protein
VARRQKRPVSQQDRTLIELAHPPAQCAEVVQKPEAEKAVGNGKDRAGALFGHPEAVDAEGSQESERAQRLPYTSQKMRCPLPAGHGASLTVMPRFALFQMATTSR